MVKVWNQYSCLTPTEDFNPLFEFILNGVIGFNLRGVFEAFWDNGECHFVLNSQSDVVIRWYVNDFETVDFMPIVFFEFEERYGEQIANATWSYNHKGVVFPLLNVGFLYIWMDASNALQFNEVLNCSMKRQSAPKNFGYCTSYVYY